MNPRCLSSSPSKLLLLTGWRRGLLALAVATGGGIARAETVELAVYPTITRSIAGVSELDREKYFSMCDPGTNFDQRMRSPERVEYLLGELNATFGRNLGPINSAVGDADRLGEDPERPGFADPDSVKSACEQRVKPPAAAFASLAGGRLDVAAHGRGLDFPDFMGRFSTPEADRDSHAVKHYLPGYTDAAAELAAAALEYGYTDFDRPAYYEPINEPHWSFISDEHLANWHTKAHAAVHGRGLAVKVGGPCLSVAYFYRNNYRAFEGFKNFLANTRAELDFYSFHVYDYLNWDGADLHGRVTGGLPLEGVLDFVQTHAVNTYGKPIDLVVSEHGGYITASQGRPNAKAIGELLVSKQDNAAAFDQTVLERSVASHVLISSAIANTLTFMEHAHIVQKAVPFILPETMGWDPEYYPTMFVPYGFEDRSRWVETHNTDFYKFFRDVAGRRVCTRGGDPDLQTRAFADGSTLRVVINNLSDAPHQVRLKMPAAKTVSVRRYGRNDDYTPYLRESDADAAGAIEIAGREAVVVSADYAQPIPNRKTMSETPHYGSRTIVSPSPGKPSRFLVETESPATATYAMLRIGVTRPAGADPRLQVKLNGRSVDVPLEDAAPRLDDGEKEYASTKLIPVDPDRLREKNRVEVSFSDGEAGTIGSVVIRVGRLVK
ncbi:MAG: beta-agarase [Planctomycetota bacterium]